MFLLSHCALLAFVFFYSFFFFNDTATTEIYTLSLHDALPISVGGGLHDSLHDLGGGERHLLHGEPRLAPLLPAHDERSEEHTSELQSRLHLVCRLLLEKKKKNKSLIESEHDTEVNNARHAPYK